MNFAARCETLRSHKPTKNTSCHGLSFSWVFFMQMKFKAWLFPLHARQCVHGTWLCYRQSFNPIWHATYCDSGCPHPQVWFYSRKDNYFTFHLKFIIRGRETGKWQVIAFQSQHHSSSNILVKAGEMRGIEKELVRGVIQRQSGRNEKEGLISIMKR